DVEMGLDVRGGGPQARLPTSDAVGRERHLRLVGTRRAGNQRDQRITARHQAGGARWDAVRRNATLLDGVRRSRRGPRVRRRRPIEIPTTGAARVAIITFLSLLIADRPSQ